MAPSMQPSPRVLIFYSPNNRKKTVDIKKQHDKTVRKATQKHAFAIISSRIRSYSLTLLLLFYPRAQKYKHTRSHSLRLAPAKAKGKKVTSSIKHGRSQDEDLLMSLAVFSVLLLLCSTIMFLLVYWRIFPLRGSTAKSTHVARKRVASQIDWVHTHVYTRWTVLIEGDKKRWGSTIRRKMK